MGQWRIWAVKTKFSTKLLISRANTVQLEIHAFVSTFVFAADLLQRGSNVFCHYMFQKYLIFFFFLFRVLRQAQKNISEASENQWGTFRGYLQGGTSYIMGNIIFGTRDPSFGDKLKCLMKCFRWLKKSLNSCHHRLKVRYHLNYTFLSERLWCLCEDSNLCLLISDNCTLLDCYISSSA